MCPLLSVRFYSFYFFIRFSMNIFLTKHPSGWSLCFWLSYPRCLAPDTVGWWAQVDSNHRPRAYQARALTTWAMSPLSYSVYLISFSRLSCLRLFAVGGDDGIRTHDPLLAGQVLSQLSYTPSLFLRGYFTVTENWTTKIEALRFHRAPFTHNI